MVTEGNWTHENFIIYKNIKPQCYISEMNICTSIIT